MREIEFRAKTKNKNMWGYGDLIHDENGYSILSKKEGCLKIKPNTIGQYTGLKDKNGKKIFEGDILEFDFYDIGKQRAFVYWNEKYCAFLLNVISNNFEFAKISDGKVIGNIYENPELLKGE